MRKHHSVTLLVTLGTLCLITAFAGCNSQPQETNQLSQYSENIEVGVMLSDQDALNDLDRDDIIFTVTNNGDKTVTELTGDVVFYDSAGNEIGRTGTLLISVNPSMEEIAVEEKKARWRPLPPGGNITTGYDVVTFFGGEPDLRDTVRAQWNNLSVSIFITKIATE